MIRLSNTTIISVEDVVNTLKETKAPLEPALWFASELTGVSIDKLMEWMGESAERHVSQAGIEYQPVSEMFRRDIEGEYEEMCKMGEISENAVAPTPFELNQALGKNDAYWDVYWGTIQQLIRDKNA